MRTRLFRRRWVLALVPVLAIPGCGPGTGPAPVKCLRTGTQMIEVADNFTSPSAPAPYRSAVLSSMLASLPATQDFDETKIDAAFGASFRIDAHPVCSVHLDVGVRHDPTPIPPPGGTGNSNTGASTDKLAAGWPNDAIEVGVAPFGTNDPRFYSAVIWKTGDPPSGIKLLSFDLSPTVNGYLNGTVPPIDVYIQDDTNVDFIRVTWTY